MTTDSDEIWYVVVIIAVLIGVIYNKNQNKGFVRGKNTIFENDKYDKNIISTNEPFKFEEEIAYPYKFKINSSIFIFFIGFAFIIIDYFFIDYNYGLFSIIGGLIILLSIIWVVSIINKKDKYKSGIFKIDKKGLWTVNLGFVPWNLIKEINIYYVFKNKLKPTEVSYLEIITFKKQTDKLYLHEIGYDKRKLSDIIEKSGR